MFISSTTTYTNNSLFKSLISWQIEFLIVFILVCLLILFFYWKYPIRKLFIKRQKLIHNHQQPPDTIRKIPLQTSVSKRRKLVSKSLKTKTKSNKVVFSKDAAIHILYFLKERKTPLRCIFRL